MLSIKELVRSGMIILIELQWIKVLNLTDYKRQADLDHIEEDIFDRPPSTNLRMRLMQIILNALANSLESAKPPNLINTHPPAPPPTPCNLDTQLTLFILARSKLGRFLRMTSAICPKRD